MKGGIDIDLGDGYLSGVFVDLLHDLLEVLQALGIERGHENLFFAGARRT